MKCPNCQNFVDENAVTCPSCGRPLERLNKKNCKSRFWLGFFAWFFASVIGFAFGVSYFPYQSRAYKSFIEGCIASLLVHLFIAAIILLVVIIRGELLK